MIMRIECNVEAYLERYDSDGYVKPYFFNIPYSKEIEKSCFDWHPHTKEKVIDSKGLGTMIEFFYALSKPNEKYIKLNLILTDEKEKHEDWIELEKKRKDYGVYEVHGLDNYDGEACFDDKNTLYLNLEEFYHISNPKYIYLKKI